MIIKIDKLLIGIDNKKPGTVNSGLHHFFGGEGSE